MTHFLEDKKYFVALAILILLFIGLAGKGIFAVMPGDEHKWHYSGYLLSEGKIPYRDFFYGHPPIQAVLLSFVFLIFGFSLTAMKLIPFISTIGISVLIFLIVKRKQGGLAGIISSALFLFSYTIMFNSAISFGVMLASMILLFGYFFLEKEKFALAGIFFGIASLTRLLTLLPIFVIFVWIFFSDRKNFKKVFSYFVVVFVSVNLILILLFEKAYLAPVYMLHILKDPIQSLVFAEYSSMISLNWILACLFVLSSAYSLAVQKKISLSASIGIAYCIAMLFIKRLYGYYFIPAFPFIAMSCGIFLQGFLGKIAAKNKKYFFAACIVLIGIFAWDASSNSLFISKTGFSDFERLNDIKEYVNLRFEDNYEIFGDDSVVPLIALETKRNIAFNHFETNEGVFESGIIDINELLNKISKKDVIFVVRSLQGMSKFKETRKFLYDNCEFMSSFSDQVEKEIIVYKCPKRT